MNEVSNHVVSLMQLSRQLQFEMARAYQPNAEKIAQLCQEIENSACAVYKWSRGIKGGQDESEVG